MKKGLLTEESMKDRKDRFSELSLVVTRNICTDLHVHDVLLRHFVKRQYAVTRDTEEIS